MRTMTASAASLRTFALESALGRITYAGANLLLGAATRDPWRRAVPLLRAWRASDNPLVRIAALHHLKNALGRDDVAVSLRENPLLDSFARSPAARAIRHEFAGFSLSDRLRMRFPRNGEDPERQGDLIVLKRAIPATGEKGVLLIKYSEAVPRFAALFDVGRLVERYSIVIEPSWWGYQDASFYLLAGSDANIVIQSQARADHEFLSTHGMGLHPIRIGAGDWIDPEVFVPSGGARDYDLVMVSSWNPFKRHNDLFGAVAEIRRKGRKLRLALIGYSNGWSGDDIRAGLRRYGLEEQSDIFDSVPSQTVAEIVSRSRLYVLLSHREGANKAMYEAMFCDTPVLAPMDHRGINHADLNEHTGVAFERGELARSITIALDRSDSFAPREWALANTGFENATRRLNAVLRDLALTRGEAWSVDIVAKKNQPNLRYARREDLEAVQPEFDSLEGYLRTPD